MYYACKCTGGTLNMVSMHNFNSFLTVNFEVYNLDLDLDEGVRKKEKPSNLR